MRLEGPPARTAAALRRTVARRMLRAPVDVAVPVIVAEMPDVRGMDQPADELPVDSLGELAVRAARAPDATGRDASSPLRPQPAMVYPVATLGRARTRQTAPIGHSGAGPESNREASGNEPEPATRLPHET